MSPRRRGWLIALGAAALVVVGLGVAAFQPRVANHFGYGLPGPHGLPYNIHVLGRDYSNPSQCADDNWCASKAAENTCWTQDKLTNEGMWPLVKVGSVTTLLGPTLPVLEPDIAVGSTSTLMFVPHSGACYLVFELQGGV